MIVETSNCDSPTKRQKKLVSLEKKFGSLRRSGKNDNEDSTNESENVVDQTEDSTMYYYNDACKDSPKVVNLFISNKRLPNIIRDDTTNPIGLEEGLALARSFKILIVTHKDSEEIKYAGPTEHLSDIQIKKLIVNEKTFNIRTPTIAVKETSILLVGWSKVIWTTYAILRCTFNENNQQQEDINLI